MHRPIAFLIVGMMLALPAGAAPAAYVLEPEESSVGFETDFGPDRITGTFTVTRADLTVDFDRPANTQVAVTLDTRRATASFPFAAQAMKGPKVLDSATWPEITFLSRAVRTAGDGAQVDGDLTIRGVTRPVTLQASLYRQRGTAEGDLRQLTIRLTGAVNRSDYGATGWNDMVGDQVRIDILARIRQAD
jgi:polyisoprenoid-binding protein YceI